MKGLDEAGPHRVGLIGYDAHIKNCSVAIQANVGLLTHHAEKPVH